MGVDALAFLHRTREKPSHERSGQLRGTAARWRRSRGLDSARGLDDRRAEAWGSPEGIDILPRLRPRAPRGPRRARHLAGPEPVPARALPDDVHDPAVDDPAVRRLLHRRGVQRVLPAQPRGRPEGPLGRLRPRDPPRLRLRPPAGARRRRHGRRGDRLDLRHADALRRHPARRDVGVDDDERRGAAGDGALHRRGRGAGGEAGAARGDHPERHPQGVHGPQHLHLPAGAEHADHLRHLRVHRRSRCRASTRSRSPATTSRRPGRRPTSSSPTRWPTASSTSAPASTPGSTIDQFAPRLSLLLGDRHELLHGGRQDARRPRAVGAAGARLRPAEPQVAHRCAPTARPPAGRSPRRTSSTTSAAPASRRWPRPRATPSRCTPTPSTRRSRCRPTSRPGSPATPSCCSSRSRGTTEIIDPWAGSYYVERLTHDLAERAWAHIQEAEGPAAWPRPSSRASPRCASRRRPPAPRRASTPATQKVIGVNTYRLAAEDKLDVLRVDNDDVYRQQIAKLERLRAERDDDDVRRALEALTRSRRARGRRGRLARRQPARAGRRRGPRQGHGRRDLRRAGEGLRPAPGRDPYDHRRVPRRGRQGERRAPDGKVAAGPRRDRRVRGGRGPPPAHPGRQDGPGRPRPRPEGRRHRLRRPRLRRRRGAAVLHARGGRPAGGRRRRAHRRGLLAGRRPPHAAARAQAGAGRPGPRRTSWSSSAASSRPTTWPTLEEMGAAAVFLPGTVIAESALDLLAKLRSRLMARPRRRRPRRGHPRRAARGGLPGDHARRVVAGRPPRGRARAADRAAGGTGGLDPGRHLRASRASASPPSSRRSARS